MEVTKPKFWFANDHHQGHANMIKYDNESLEEHLGYKPRDYQSVEEMDRDIVQQHNALVAPHDLVYFVGDYSLDKSLERARSILLRLNGVKHLVLGNHRSTDVQLAECFVWQKEYYELLIEDPNARYGKQLICLFHYPVVEWHQAHRGSWCLTGHVHGKYDKLFASHGTSELYKTMDIGIMLNGMKPYSYDQIKKIMSTRSSLPHH